MTSLSRPPLSLSRSLLASLCRLWLAQVLAKNLQHFCGFISLNFIGFSIRLALQLQLEVGRDRGWRHVMDSLRKYLHLQLLIEPSPSWPCEARRHNNKQRTRYGQTNCRTAGRLNGRKEQPKVLQVKMRCQYKYL